MTQTNGIGNNQLSSSFTDRADRAQMEKHTKTTLAQASSASAKQDVANLSGAGNVLAAAVTSTADVRADRVAALKASVDAGTYNVSSTAVADKLLDSMLE